MKDESMKKQNFLQGAAILAAATLIVKLLGFLFKTPLNYIIGETGSSYFYNAYRVYDVPVRTVTHVTVVLEEMPQRAVFIQHVTVNGDATTDFTQGIEVWPVWYSAPQDWTRGGYCTGRVLCDRGGQPLAAPFSRL